MKKFTYIFLSCMLLMIGHACAPTYYNPIVVRPASCSPHLQFAESPDLSYLLAFADKMEKPVFLDFYAPWIPTCQRIDDNVFTQGSVAAYFNQNFINYKVNAGGASPGPELTDRYGVTTFPTFLFVDGKGKVMMRHEGYVTADKLLEMGQFIHHGEDKDVLSMGTK